MNDAAGVIRGWHLRRFGGEEPWDQKKRLIEHVERVLHHEVELSKQKTSLEERVSQLQFELSERIKELQRELEGVQKHLDKALVEKRAEAGASLNLSDELTQARHLMDGFGIQQRRCSSYLEQNEHV